MSGGKHGFDLANFFYRRLRAESNQYILHYTNGRVTIYGEASGRVALGLALKEAASNIESIQRLNVTPDLLGSTFQQFLRNQGDEPKGE